MKLKVAIIHKEQQVKTRNYKTWITKHKVTTDDGMFTINKFQQSYALPRPEDDVLLLDDKWILYTDGQVTPLDRNWEPAKQSPAELRLAIDSHWIRSLVAEVYLNSSGSYLTNMFKSWCRKLTIRKPEEKITEEVTNGS